MQAEQTGRGLKREALVVRPAPRPRRPHHPHHALTVVPALERERGRVRLLADGARARGVERGKSGRRCGAGGGPIRWAGHRAVAQWAPRLAAARCGAGDGLSLSPSHVFSGPLFVPHTTWCARVRAGLDRAGRRGRVGAVGAALRRPLTPYGPPQAPAPVPVAVADPVAAAGGGRSAARGSGAGRRRACRERRRCPPAASRPLRGPRGGAASS